MKNEQRTPSAGGRLIFWNVMTLDGFFEAKNKWEIDFHNSVWGEELERFSTEQLQSCSALVFGRVTYEGMAAYWKKETGEIADFMNSLPKIVCSRTLKQVDWANTTIVSGDIEQEIASIKRRSEKDLFVFGSADLSATLMQHGLIDEYRICLAPVVLGAGTPLFKPRQEQLTMKLLEARPLKTGGIILRYQPVM
ncbi:MAG: dihydrofolate reductase [Bacteroidetes bacterium]|nr:dihydrofolate reductase [Bacteroidota bacterium]